MDGVVLDVDHLQQPDAGRVGKMVQREGQAQEVDDLLEPWLFKIAGAGFLFEFLHDLRALGGVQGRCIHGMLGHRLRRQVVVFVIGHLIDTPLL